MYVDEKGPVHLEANAGPEHPHHHGPPPPPPPPPHPDHDRNRLPDVSAEDPKDVCTFDWDQKLSCFGCCCFSFLKQLIFLACIGSFLFGFNLGLFNTCLNHIGWEYHLCDYDDPSGKEEIMDCTLATNFKAFIPTGVFIGAAIGSMTGGPFLSFGRRTMILIGLCVFIFGIISSVCANSFSAMFWARLMVGYAVGLISVGCPAYMSEVTPPAVRGKYGVYHQLFITIGILAADLIGLPMISNPVPDDGGPYEDPDTFTRVWWRVMVGIGIVPVFVMIYALLKVYTFDTPHYYLDNGHYADAEALMRKILGKDDVSEEMQAINEEIESGKRARAAGMSLGAAFGNAEFRWVIIFGCLLSAFQQFSGINVFIASSTDLFNEAGLEGDMATVMTVVMALINVLCTLPAVYLIERLGRKTLLAIGTIGMTIIVLPATICYWALEDDEDGTPTVTMILAIVGCLGFIVLFACTYGPILWVYLFEIYPMEIKNSAAGLATAFNWIAGIIMVFIQAYLDNKILYTLFTALCCCGALLVVFGMKETKGRVLGDSPFITKSN